MGTLNIVVRKRALSTIQKVAEWYMCEVNNTAHSILLMTSIMSFYIVAFPVYWTIG